MKFKGNKHNFFCRCPYCKQKRRTSLLYLGAIIALTVIILYQALLLIFLVTRFHAILLLLELILLVFLIFLLLF